MRTIATLVVVSALLSTTAAAGQTLPIREATAVTKKQTSTSTEQKQQQQLRQSARQIGELRQVSWACQDSLGVKRTRASTSVWSLPQSVPYRIWTATKWQDIAKDCQKQRAAYGGVIDKLNRGLAGTPMAGTGAELERAGRRHGISPYFIAAIAATESSLGEAACRNNRFNAWGLSSCGSGWYVPPFGSWAKAYDFMGNFLSSRWQGASSTYDFHGYAACSSCWGSKTAMHMQRLFGVSNHVRYY